MDVGNENPYWVDPGRLPVAPLPSSAAMLAELEPAQRSSALTRAREFMDGTRVDALAAVSDEWLLELAESDRVPIPAPEDREGYYGEEHLAYWLSGVGEALSLIETCRELGVSLDAGSGLLDFGCASGRVLGHFPALVPGARAVGADLATNNVSWARTHLGAATPVVQSSVIPTLPFADGSFDLIYGGSVFTHIDHTEEAWLAEIARVLADSGVCVLTIHPQRIWAEMRDESHFIRKVFLSMPTRIVSPVEEAVDARTFDREPPGPRIVFTHDQSPIYNANVIHSHSWVRERWSRFLAIERIVERGYAGHQDVVVASSLAAGAPSRGRAGVAARPSRGPASGRDDRRRRRGGPLT